MKDTTNALRRFAEHVDGKITRDELVRDLSNLSTQVIESLPNGKIRDDVIESKITETIDMSHAEIRDVIESFYMDHGDQIVSLHVSEESIATVVLKK